MRQRDRAAAQQELPPCEHGEPREEASREQHGDDQDRGDPQRIASVGGAGGPRRGDEDVRRGVLRGDLGVDSLDIVLDVDWLRVYVPDSPCVELHPGSGRLQGAGGHGGSRGGRRPGAGVLRLPQRHRPVARAGRREPPVRPDPAATPLLLGGRPRVEGLHVAVEREVCERHRQQPRGASEQASQVHLPSPQASGAAQRAG
mmetsp:Transcript_41815/g.120005  ORF Transcript_41815/g.120005 Transcript_41815/m.120005 type:complete len:201 (-) Transcript_41815:25-627(-)